MTVSWTRTKQLFSEALELEPSSRSAFLIETCGDDPTLRAEVESLLASHERADSFFEGAGAAILRPTALVDMSGRLVGDYRIVREAGCGGTSIVYLAERADQHYEKHVAIKMLRSIDGGTEILQRFRIERQTLAKLDHPNIVTLLDGGSVDGMPYLVMDFVEGVPIDQYCQEHALSVSQRLRIFRAVCDTVQYAHHNGVIHRDLKPSNILVTNEGAPRLLDFGIAKLRDPQRFALSTLVTLSGMQAMTPEYASPEQLRGQPVTAATDIYSLGVLLYVLLSGHHPYRATGHSILDWHRAVCEIEPVRPSVAAACGGAGAAERDPVDPNEAPDPLEPQRTSNARDFGALRRSRELRGDLDAIAMKALNKEPERRYASAQELSDDIDRHLNGRAVSARRTTVPYRMMKFAGRHRESLAVAAIAVAAAAAVASWEVQRVRAVRSDRVSGPTYAVSRPSVAVLGFKNLSGRDNTAWLGTALSEMLTTELAAGGKARLLPGETIARARIELALPDVATLSADTLKAVRQRLGSDFIVSGSYLDMGAQDGHIRLDLRLQDAARGEVLSSVSVEGEEQQLLDLVSRSGVQLRDRLGLPSILPADSTRVQDALPSNTEAARLYSEGLARLRAFDALAARDLLAKAVATDPDYPLAHSALSQAWLALGFDTKGRDEARIALETAGQLVRENHLLVEARANEASRDWPKAIEAYRTLFNFFPDNPEYGLALVRAQTQAGQGKEVMGTIERLRRLPREAEFDPRVDLATANAASLLSDNGLQASAADSAVRKGRLIGAKLLVAEARAQQCRALVNLGDFDKSAAACEEARAISEAAGDWAGTARALHSIAEVPMDRGDNDRAQVLYEQALAIVRRIGDQRGIARELGNLGQIFRSEGYWSKAVQYEQDMLDVSREIGRQIYVADALETLGQISRAQGRPAEALGRAQESISMARAIGNTELVALDQIDIGDILADQGNLAEAARLFDLSLKIFRNIGENGNQAMTLAEIGRVRAARGDAVSARALYEQALAIQAPLDVKGDLAATQVAIAELVCDTDAAEAEKLLRAALPEFQFEKRGTDELRVHAILARALLRLGRTAAARAAVDAAVALFDRGSLMDRIEWKFADARVRLAEGNVARAEIVAQQSFDEAKSHGLVGAQFEASLILGQIHAMGPDPAHARSELMSLSEAARNKGFGHIANQAAALAARPGASTATEI
ncbi:MAG: protein kinase domain-containing protein [Steroidobacteraceae bacterium]|jgi:serine/threonine protein kinase/tetratricopeptide (TPR) repeat protein